MVPGGTAALTPKFQKPMGDARWREVATGLGLVGECMSYHWLPLNTLSLSLVKHTADT